ncbi:MAG: O-antigen ligase family protein [Gaiella sp.]
MTRRLPALGLAVLAAGLLLHNLAMVSLYGLGIEGAALDAIAAWKDAVLVAAVAVGLWLVRGRIELRLVDWLALAYGALVLLYWLLPQDWLGDGDATARGELLAARHHLLPVGGYLLGRVILEPAAARRLLRPIVAAGAVALAVWGLIDVYGVPLSFWRDSAVPGWFRDQLGIGYACFGGLPENWILNSGDETSPLRRLVSVFWSPLATSYTLVVVLLGLVAWRPSRLGLAAAVPIGAGLLWTHTRAAFLALALGLAVLGLVRRRRGYLVAAAATVAVALVFVQVFPSIAPATRYTSQELACLRDNAAREGATGDALSSNDASTRSHLRNLRDGVETMLRHPWGYGVGNTGVTAKRSGVEIKAGESTYTELGVDLGLAGALVFIGWLGAMVAGARREPWAVASLAALALLALQSDAIGIPWLAVVVFALGGMAVTEAQPVTTRSTRDGAEQKPVMSS